MVNRKLLVSYMTLGYPDEENFIKFINGAEMLGSDIMEIGIPPRYAKYDGPVIRKSYSVVMKKLKDYRPLLKRARKELSIPIVILTYLEEFENRLDEFLEELKTYEIDGILFPDLLIDYIDDYERYYKTIKDHGLKTVIFVTPTVPDALISKVSPISDIFLYYGVRPTTGVPIPISPSALVRRVRGLVNNKLVVGFGLSDEDIREVIVSGADGVAIGTAYIERIEKEGVSSALDLVNGLRGILDEFQ